MIAARFGPCAVEVRGHAGYAPPGQDIVCAAASVLCYALRAALEEAAAAHAAEAADGWTRVRAWPADACRARVEGMFAVCRAGFWLLAESYPGCVQILSGDRSYDKKGSEDSPENGQKEEQE